MEARKQDTPYNRDLRRIWAGARELGMDSETVHELLKNLTGKKSLTDTDKRERWKLIQELNRKGAFVYHPLHRRKGRGTGDRSVPATRGAAALQRPRGAATNMITPRQQTFIQTLWAELGAVQEDFQRVAYRTGFTRIAIGREYPQTVGEGQILIEALKARKRQILKS